MEIDRQLNTNSNMQQFDVEDPKAQSDQNKQQFIPSSEEQQRFGLFANTRIGFIQKVYSILSVQLLFTTLMCWVAIQSQAMSQFMQNNVGMFVIVIIIEFIVMIVLYCNESASKQVPLNYILLGIFTLAEAYIVAAICCQTNPRIVIMAALLTSGITVSLTIYAMTTKTDFTVQGGLLYMLSMVLILMVFISLFSQNKILHVIITGFAALLFGVYLIYDTQLIVGGHKHSLEVDDYIIAALTLYIDIISLFLQILELLRQADQ